jgi:hypothetical protein
MSAAFLPPEFHDTPDGKVCMRCGKDEGVEKRANREWLCKGCWAAVNSGEPIRDIWMEAKE